MKMIIADDHALFRETLGEFADRHFPNSDVKFADDFYSALELVKKFPDQDLILLDLRMPGMADMKGFYVLREEFPTIKVALMSGLADPHDVRRAMDAGAVGYFPKTLSGKEFIKGIQQVVDGQVFVPVDAETNVIMPSYKIDEAEQISPDNKGKRASFITSTDYSLTTKENEVLPYLVQGLTNKEIAINMGIQEVTVKLHVSGICKKLNVKNRTQAALKSRELGLIQVRKA